MKARSTKYSLLNTTEAKQQLLDDENIETIYGNSKSQSNDVPYSRLQTSRTSKINQTKNNLKNQPVFVSNSSKPDHVYLNNKNEQKFCKQVSSQLQTSLYQNPYSSSSNTNLCSSNIKNRPPLFPLVITACTQCNCKQRIAGNINQFYCCQCGHLNSIEPSFGMFICGVCNQRVPYKLGVSDYIRCHICSTVNKVPQYKPTSKINAESFKKQKQQTKQLTQIQKIKLEIEKGQTL